MNVRILYHSRVPRSSPILAAPGKVEQSTPRMLDSHPPLPPKSSLETRPPVGETETGRFPRGPIRLLPDEPA